MIVTSLARIRYHGPCPQGWAKLLHNIGKTCADDDPLPFSVIVGSNGIDDALWCCRAEPQYAVEWRLYAVRRARQVWHLIPDARSRAVVELAERYAKCKASAEELAAAVDAAKAEARPAGPAGMAARAAALATAKPSAGVAAWETAWEAVWAASWEAARVAEMATVRACARPAVVETARSAAVSATRATQTQDFLRLVDEADPASRLAQGV